MPNRTAIWFFRSFLILVVAASVSACNYVVNEESDSDGESSAEMVEESESTEGAEAAEEAPAMMEMEAEACPHGGGACCEHDEPHPCCEHTMKEDSGAESQPASQPSE